ncbi:MAG: hypothetical protein O7C75_20140 [Verrucomicrobia bacterium]|nr:hypothetical protein [Verrucomicrobiota bacterium]
MKKSLLIPALLLACTPLLATVVEDQASACISENGSNQQGLESCLSRLFVPASMDCDELLQVHRTILAAAQGRNNATVRAVTRVSSKLAIISLAANCYSPDVAARLVARTGSEIGGNSNIIADATVAGAIDAANSLGVDSGSLANSASTSSLPGGTTDGGGGTPPTTGPIPIYYDNEVVVSPEKKDT